MIDFIGYRKMYYFIAGIMTAISLVLLISWGIKFGIDFTGGSLLEIEYIGSDRPEISELDKKISPLNLGKVDIQPVGDNSFILRLKEINIEEHQKIVEVLGLSLTKDSENQNNLVLEKRFEAIGPTIGNELKNKTMWALFLALIGIVIYITWAFRKVSWPVESWKYGVVSTLALAFNVIVVLGFFAYLSKYFGLEINTPFVAAILTILGYTINDTIVVMDRIRENLGRLKLNFVETVNLALNDTLARSCNTSLTTLFTLVMIYIFGGATIKDFILALIIGILVGAFSSIFFACPLLVDWYLFSQNNKK